MTKRLNDTNFFLNTARNTPFPVRPCPYAQALAIDTSCGVMDEFREIYWRDRRRDWWMVREIRFWRIDGRMDRVRMNDGRGCLCTVLGDRHGRYDGHHKLHWGGGGSMPERTYVKNYDGPTTCDTKTVWNRVRQFVSTSLGYSFQSTHTHTRSGAMRFDFERFVKLKNTTLVWKTNQNIFINANFVFESKKTFFRLFKFFSNLDSCSNSVERFSGNINAPISDIATDILLPIKVPKEKSV